MEGTLKPIERRLDLLEGIAELKALSKTEDDEYSSLASQKAFFQKGLSFCGNKKCELLVASLVIVI